MKSCSCPKYMWSAMLVGILCATVTESLPPNFDAIEQRHSYIMYYCQSRFMHMETHAFIILTKTTA